MIRYWFVGVVFIILTILIIWETLNIRKNIKQMGQGLLKERKRLQNLMVIFALSYVATSAFFISEVVRSLDCTGTEECTSFIDLMTTFCVFLICDVLTMAELYR